MNWKPVRWLFIGTAMCCLSAAPALSYGLGGDTRTETRPANMGEIDNHAIDIYEKEMRSALSISDPPRRDAAVTSARQQLAQNIRKPLTAGTIEELDGLLDLGGLSPELGATA